MPTTLTLESGTAATVAKQYLVYLGLPIETASAVTAIKTATPPTKTLMNALTGTMKELGEIRADSLEITTEDGTVIEGNVSGEIVLDKNGKFMSELINCTQTNINALADLDRTKVTILVVEKDTHKTSNVAGFKTFVIIDGLTLRYNESIKGKDVVRGTVSVSQTVSKIADFRHINEYQSI